MHSDCYFVLLIRSAIHWLEPGGYLLLSVFLSHHWSY